MNVSHAVEGLRAALGVRTATLLALGLVWGIPATAAAWPGFGDTSAAPKCDSETELMAVLYNDGNPDRSMAMVANKQDAGRLVGVGSWVRGRPVLAVVPQALWLGPLESPCWIPLNHDGNQKVQARRVKKKKKRKRRRRKRRR